MKFLHTSIRLHTHLGRAFRYFKQPELLSQWMGQCSFDESNQTMKFTDILTQGDHWSWRIVEDQRESHLICDCTAYNDSSEYLYSLEIHFMKCTSLTEYCTEIHVVQKDFEKGPNVEETRERYKILLDECLDRLRIIFNGPWIITDRELTFDIFK